MNVIIERYDFILRVRVLHQVAMGIKPAILTKLKRKVRTFIELCIEKDPHKRPNAKELLTHPFLDGVYANQLHRLPVTHFILNNNNKNNNKSSKNNDNKLLLNDNLGQIPTIIEGIPNKAILNDTKSNENNNKRGKASQNEVSKATIIMTLVQIKRQKKQD